MDDERITDDRIEESDETLAPASSAGDNDELLVGASGRADIAGRLVEDVPDVGDYDGPNESMDPDYEYRVGSTVSDQYGEYPAPGDPDLPLGYTTDDRLAAEEGLSYFPPEDPPTLPDDNAGQGLEVAAGFGASLHDAGYEPIDLPPTVEGNDDDLADKLLAALEITSLLTGFRLKVEVHDAVAYISGVVSAFEDIALLDSIVYNIPGIDDVDMDDVEVSERAIEGIKEVISTQATPNDDKALE